MAQNIHTALQQLFDSSGAPYSGAKMYIYETGTTTPIALYSDEALSTAIANPLVADAAGVFPQAFIGTAYTRFNLVIKDADDAAIYSRDPVYSISRSDSFAASAVTFDGSGIGFSATNVQEAIEEVTTSVSTSPTFNDTADSSKQLTFDLTGISTSTEWTVTWPDGNVTIPAGTLAANDETHGQHTMVIPASAMIPATTNGASPAVLESSSNAVMMAYLAFDASTEEFAQFGVQMPKSWDEGTVIVQFVWSHPSTTTNFGVVWGVEALALADGDALDAAWGTEVTVADTGGTTDDIYISPESTAVTPAGSPAAEEFVMFRITRVVGDASNTMAVDARLISVKIHYTTNASTDT